MFFTYSGHDSSCAAALVVLDILVREIQTLDWWDAANAFTELGEAAAPAVPELVDLLDSAQHIDRETVAHVDKERMPAADIERRLLGHLDQLPVVAVAPYQSFLRRLAEGDAELQ